MLLLPFIFLKVFKRVVFSMDYHFLISLAYSHCILGSLIIGFLSSFTIFFPSPFFILVFFLPSHLSPFLVGLFAGIGSAVGELTSYYAGFFTERIFFKKFEKYLNKVELKFKKYHPNFVIFFFSATPSPFDAVGILCGLIKYDLKTFFVFTLLGKLVKYWFIAYAGYYGLNYLLPFLHFHF